MMKRIALGLASLLWVLPLLVGCAGEPAGIEAKLGQEFSLQIGQEASITGEDLRISFEDVIGDSRCPQGATCIWAGEASCLVKIGYSGAVYSKVLTLSGSESPKTDFQEYEIKFNLLPYPQLGKEIQRKDYTLSLVIDKKSALTGGILVTFDVVGESYSIFITNEETVEQVFALQRGETDATIPSGRLIRGAVSYNMPWSWHIDSEDIQMAEVTIELCDGTPSQVEANLDYWVNTVQRFCPWSAKIAKVQDFR